MAAENGLPEVMTVGDVAAYLRYTEEHVRRLARQGKIPAAKPGRAWRFSRRQILQWIENGCPAQPKRLIDEDRP
jgi:excisionase family DNA binding protein